jgi:hypothetical protein
MTPGMAQFDLVPTMTQFDARGCNLCYLEAALRILGSSPSGLEGSLEGFSQIRFPRKAPRLLPPAETKAVPSRSTLSTRNSDAADQQSAQSKNKSVRDILRQSLRLLNGLSIIQA